MKRDYATPELSSKRINIKWSGG